MADKKEVKNQPEKGRDNPAAKTELDPTREDLGANYGVTLTDTQKNVAKVLAELGIPGKVADEMARDGYTVDNIISAGLQELIDRYDFTPNQADKVRQEANKYKADQAGKSAKLQRIHDANDYQGE
jgi:hypothetical protein